MAINRDSIVAIFLLLFCGLMLRASFEIRDPGHDMMAPATWPQIVLLAFSLLCLVYAFQAFRAGAAGIGEAGEGGAPRGSGLLGWLRAYRNPIFCYLIYFAFLASLSYLGALIGGVLLVFCLLTVLGGFGPALLLRHAVIAVVSVGAMWALFTFGLRVILPQGEIFTVL